jgi:hypothetical protein
MVTLNLQEYLMRLLILRDAFVAGELPEPFAYSQTVAPGGEAPGGISYDALVTCTVTLPVVFVANGPDLADALVVVIDPAEVAT